MFTGRRRIKRTAAEEIAFQEKKAAKLANKIVGECQCCGRSIGATMGVIAHHGYQRPSGWGSQTSSCMGARYPEFKLSRDRLGQMIDLIHRDLTKAQERLLELDLDGDDLELTVVFPDYSRRIGGFGSRSYPNRFVSFTKATFETVRDATPQNKADFRTYSFYSFDKVRESKVAEQRRLVDNLMVDWVAQKKRYKSWKPPV